MSVFREMRRKRQLLPEEACLHLLRTCATGVLAVRGDDDYPYAVPLNYCYEDGKLWFHCAKSGHKLDAVRRHDKVSFCVIGEDQVVPETFSTDYRSVIVFGRVRELEGEEKRQAIEKLTEKYAPAESPERRQQAVEADYGALCMLELTVEHMTGKEGKRLSQLRSPWGAAGAKN